MSTERQEESLSRQESFISHLIELRSRLLRSITAVAVLFFCLMLWPGSNVIYDFLASPLMSTLPSGTHMIATGVVTPFFVPIKVTMLVAFMLALPYILYQAWAFVAPGLYAHERRLVLPLVMGSAMLFIAGMAFCYFFVFHMAFRFIASFAPESVQLAPDIEQYLSFVMTMFLAFGVTFEVPIVVILLAKMGVVSAEKLREVRPYVIVGAFVVAAIVTPPDVVSQVMLAIPICLLYEAGVFIAAAISKQKPAAGPESNVAVPTDPKKSGAGQ
ncbi:MAG: twin-arginine translocase subunit TatC [Azoarcus sp.]|jgi:sec-independent protein translocase protein TatC|nr:twin-arginine translocase subunit TatC [Azoarcus sp.]